MAEEPGDLIELDYQYEYNNVLFGVNTPYDVEELSGFIGYPSVRSSTEDSFGSHGGTAGRHYVPTRLFSITFNVHGYLNDVMDNPLHAQLLTDVSHAFAPRSHPADELKLVYQHPGRTLRYINCRPIDVAIPQDRMYALNYPKISVRFEASDPRHYELEPKVLAITMGAATTGLTFPLQFPLNFGGGEFSGEQLASNQGDAPAHWTAEIVGPVVNPKLEAYDDAGTIFVLQFQGLTLSSTETLELSSRNRSVILNGQSRRSFLIPGSQWFLIPPWPHTMGFHYSSSTGEVTASTVTLRWSDATWGN